MADTDSKPLPSWLATLNNLLPLATTAGFIVAVIFLVGVFDGWGFSPLQLIEPSEVLLPGFLIASIFVLVIGVALIAHGVFDVLFGNLRFALKTRLSALIVLVLAPIWLPGWLHFPVWAQALASLLALGCAANIAANFLSLHGSGALTIIAGLIAFSPLPVWSATAWYMSTQLVIDKGFVRGVTITAAGGAPCDGKVLWLGGKTVVIRCDDVSRGVQLTPFKDDIKLIHKISTKP